MSGHSKWSTIKHKKAAIDAKRGKLFSKLAKEIAIAAKMGGGDVAMNVRLRSAVEKAKSNSMPSRNIENAIKKGTGDKEGLRYEEVTYEGYGPYGVAIMVECLTDNKNRTVSSVRSLFSKHGGSLGESGSVAWQFEKKGVIFITQESVEEEALMTLILEVGAEDMITSQEGYMVMTDPSAFNEVLEAIKEKGVATVSAEVTMHPKNTLDISKQAGEKIIQLVGLLDDLDDVQSVSSNEAIG